MGLSILSGSHHELVTATMEELRRQGAGDIKIFVGGTIPARDHEKLLAAGVIAIYTAEMRLEDVVASLARHLASAMGEP